MILNMTQDGISCRASKYVPQMRLPVTQETAADAKVLAFINSDKNEDGDAVFRSVTYLSSIYAGFVHSRIEMFRYTSGKTLAMEAIAILDALCQADKRMQPAARICAWLVGECLSKKIGRSAALEESDERDIDITYVSQSGKPIHVEPKNGAILANCLRNGELGIRQLPGVDGATQQMLWSAMKITDVMHADACNQMDGEIERLAALFDKTFEEHSNTKLEQPSLQKFERIRAESSDRLTAHMRAASITIETLAI